MEAPHANCDALRCSIIGRHTPRTRSIQYAAAFRFHHQRPGILDRPVEPDDDDWMSIRTPAARYARVVPEPFAQKRAWALPQLGSGECRVPVAPAAACAKCS